jgi:hypothetical protein
VADALREWIEKRGVPLALHVDWKNLYKRRANTGERLRGEEPVTQFGRMCQKLGIELIAASSPQAKGRIERMHGTHQDRLVKKLRRRGISTYDEYLPEHNRRFARPAAKPEDYHRRAPRAGELDRIFRLESERVVSQDAVVRYANRYFQREERNGALAFGQSKGLVCQGRHGGIRIEYRGREMRCRKIVAPVKPEAEARRSEWQRKAAAASVRRKPAANHPWNQAVSREALKKALRLEPSAASPPRGWRSALRAPQG